MAQAFAEMKPGLRTALDVCCHVCRAGGLFSMAVTPEV
jgi:hypothetical protein